MANDKHNNELLDAVDLLTQEREISTLITDDETGAFVEAKITHPSLLTLLVNGTGITRGSPSAETKIPIDADALEIWAQIRDLVRLWCKKLRTPFGEDLQGSIRNWYRAHVNAVRAGKVSDVNDHDVTRMVQGWVRMIEGKFEPDEKREWTSPCPEYLWVDGVLTRCGAFRNVPGNDGKLAIQLNVTKMVAECAGCGTKWQGYDEIASLRIATNMWEIEQKEHAEKSTAK